MYWIPAAIFLAHIAEEYRRFPEWATRHFGATSRAWYVYSHLPLVAASIAICGWAQAAPPRTTWPFLATSLQWILATNALFHLGTTIRFREYSPGVVTGLVLFLPATAYLLARTLREDLLSSFQVVMALGSGSIVGALVIASLWLPMNLDWKLRRIRG